ncbi:MAG: glycosyltransferase family 4 protein [Desulforhabdus sp.]|jgi:glycosyltransferase involved in cell wall biosynthesis|nr:glycosyltransferase family 4 protein [Desulforhabdus sp.]
MKIAFYCPNKPLSHPLPSGDQTIARGIHQELNRLGHRCEEITEFRSRWFWKSPARWLEAAVNLLEAYRRTRSFHPDVWLSYHTYYKSPDVLGPYICRLQKIPYVLFQPMYGTRRRKERATRVGFYLNRLAIKASCHVFTNNTDDLEALHRILPARSLTYIAPGIFPEEFERNEQAGHAIRNYYDISGRWSLLMSAAMFRADVKFDSLIYLFRALALLKHQRVSFKLLLVGDGPMEKELRRIADELLPGMVFFAGRVERKNMPAYYSAADLFVFPGLGESLGMVFLEAQACGCPVVALNTAGVPQVVLHNKTGLLVDRDGGKSMAEAVISLLENRRRREKLAVNGPLFIHEQRNLHRNYLQLSIDLHQIADSYAGKHHKSKEDLYHLRLGH